MAVESEATSSRTYGPQVAVIPAAFLRYTGSVYPRQPVNNIKGGTIRSRGILHPHKGGGFSTVGEALTR